MIALKRSTWLVFLLTLVACVTVNIYFPAAAAEKAADAIIQEVWHKDSTEKVTPPVAPSQPLGQNTLEQPTLKVRDRYFSPRTLIVTLISAISSPAYAQNIDFNANSPEISTIKAKMSTRFSKLKPLYDSGAVGLTADGYVALRDASSVPMAQRASAQQLVNAENADRKALYLAIAKANNQPSWAEQIRQVFVKRWFQQAQSGWWVQTGSGWKQK